jgi:hypothetical protein
MSNAPDHRLLEALLDSWERTHAILVNILRALPKCALAIRAAEGGHPIAEMLTHIHYVRLAFAEGARGMRVAGGACHAAAGFGAGATPSPVPAVMANRRASCSD